MSSLFREHIGSDVADGPPPSADAPSVELGTLAIPTGAGSSESSRLPKPSDHGRSSPIVNGRALTRKTSTACISSPLRAFAGTMKVVGPLVPNAQRPGRDVTLVFAK